jgi:cell division protein FtsQ
MKKWSESTYRILTDLCWLLIALLLIGTSLGWVVQRPIFWLRGIDVSVDGAAAAITAPMVAEQLKGKVEGSFFTVDIRRVRDALSELPWVRSASVSRVWPNQLAVRLELHRPIALWGQSEILTSDWKIFSANTGVVDTEENSLPQIYGLVKKAKIIYECFEHLNKVCKNYGARAASLKLSEFGGWTLEAELSGGSNLEIIFGPAETTVGMEAKLSRILGEFEKLHRYFGAAPTRIDARYDQGVAVQIPQTEKNETEEGSGDEKNAR